MPKKKVNRKIKPVLNDNTANVKLQYDIINDIHKEKKVKLTDIFENYKPVTLPKKKSKKK